MSMMDEMSPPGSSPKNAPKPYDIKLIPIGDNILPKEICSILKPEEGTSSVSFAVALLAATHTRCRALQYNLVASTLFSTPSDAHYDPNWGKGSAQEPCLLILVVLHTRCDLRSTQRVLARLWECLLLKGLLHGRGFIIPLWHLACGLLCRPTLRFAPVTMLTHTLTRLLVVTTKAKPGHNFACLTEKLHSRT